MGMRQTEAQAFPVGGGCINDCYRITAGQDQIFCKVNSAKKFPHLFEKEKKGLALLSQGSITVPAVLDLFEAGDEQVLLLEWVEAGERTERFWKNFGTRLAALHTVQHQQYGLDDDNYMGSIVQKNKYTESWSQFFQQHRLQPLLSSCVENRLLGTAEINKFGKLFPKLPSIFDEHPPCLIHGDLWSGNFMCNKKEEPVLIDPACYFGHPSVDLGMTTLFGGFRPAFYEAYAYHKHLPKNHQEQWKVANLYPLLIHLLLFGSIYLPQIRKTLEDFI